MPNKTILHAILKPKEERRLLRGHLWAYRNEFSFLPTPADGDLVDVFADNRRFVGRGFYQEAGGIALRILSYHQQEVNQDFFLSRLHQAWQLRQCQYPDSDVYRWVYGESDLLPGLIIDRYGSAAVIQSSCVFYERNLETLIHAIEQCSGITSLLWRWNGREQWIGQALESITLELDGLNAMLDLSGSQKTGLFLDQRQNWKRVRKYTDQAHVLDGYCYHGFWSMNAALGGATQVLGVDTSSSAMAHARRNAEINGLTQCTFEQNDVETVLSQGQQYDVIILDPPAFAKHRSAEKKALGQYEHINGLALESLNRNGLLISCSCSHFVSHESFYEMLKRTASKKGVRLQLLEQYGAAPDHPVLLSMPETAYLKCFVLRAI